MPKTTKKKKEICKICLQTVHLEKDGLKCFGACGSTVHYKCVSYTPGKIKDIQKHYIQVLCPCPNCDTNPSDKHDVDTIETFTCDNIRCPANNPPCCENLCCQANEESLSRPATRCPPPGSLKFCGEALCEQHKAKPGPPQHQTHGDSSNPPAEGPPQLNNDLQCKGCGGSEGADSTPGRAFAQPMPAAGCAPGCKPKQGGGIGKTPDVQCQILSNPTSMPAPRPKIGQMPPIQTDIIIIGTRAAKTVQTCNFDMSLAPQKGRSNEPTISPPMIKNMCSAVGALTEQLKTFMNNLEKFNEKSGCPNKKVRCPGSSRCPNKGVDVRFVQRPPPGHIECDQCVNQFVGEITNPFAPIKEQEESHYPEKDNYHLQYHIPDNTGNHRHSSCQQTENTFPNQHNCRNKHPRSCFAQTVQDCAAPCYCPEEDLLHKIKPVVLDE